MSEKNLRVLTISLLMLSPFCIASYFEDEKNNDFIGCSAGGTYSFNESTEKCSSEEDQTDTTNQTTNTTTGTTDNSTVSNPPLDNTTSSDNQSEPGPEIGTEPGDRIPNFSALIHYNGDLNWNEFEFYSQFNNSWNNTTSNSDKWTVVVFISTDCGHCWNAADELSTWSEQYGNETNFIAFAVNFSSNNNFNASREEVVAFQEQTTYVGCVGGNYDCAGRPGSPHQFGYIDDRNQTVMYQWGVGSTPTFFIIQPNGIVAWDKNSEDNIEDALEQFFGEE